MTMMMMMTAREDVPVGMMMTNHDFKSKLERRVPCMAPGDLVEG